MKKLLLISNGGREGYLIHCRDKIKEICGNEILFIPYALFDWDFYLDKVSKPLNEIGIEVKSIHQFENQKEAIRNAKAFLVGGGNTFHLLNKLYELDLIDLIKERVEDGVPYSGYSAGANIATVNIRTTNDMPIVEPKTFDALNFVPFNLNPHYFDPIEGVPGESKMQRINEFHKINNNVVLGLREYTYLIVNGDKMTIEGRNSLKVFRANQEPQEIKPNCDISEFLN